MRGLQRFLAVILALVFFTLLPFALLIVAAQGLFLSPDFYKQQLLKAEVYSKAYAELLPAFAEAVDLPNETPLDSEEVADLMRRLVPEAFVRAQTEKAIDEFFAVLRSDKDSLQIVVPLREIKQRAPGEVLGVLEKKLSSLPPCPQPLLSPPDLRDGFPTCVPPGADNEAFRAYFRAEVTREISRVADGLPDSLDLTKQLAEESGGVEELQEALETPRRLIGDLALGVVLLGALLLVVLFLVGILGGDSFNSGVGWVGVTLVASGLAVLLSTVVVSFGIGGATTWIVENPEMPREIASVASQLVTSMIGDLVRRVQLEAGGVTVVGAALFFVSRAI